MLYLCPNIKIIIMKKEKNEPDLNEGLPSGGFIIRKRGDDYEVFPDQQIMWRAMVDFKLMISLIGTFILVFATNEFLDRRWSKK